MSEWKKVNLKDICSEIVDCVNKTAPVCDFETPYKMLRTSDIRNGQINREGLKCVTKEVFEKWNRRGYLQKGDIIFTREAPVGEVGWLDNPENLFLGQRLMFFRADLKKCNSRFLFYTLFFRDNKLSIIAKANGSTVNHLRVPECENIEISIPDLPTQTRIATILSRYDSLIENYQKQIKLLEEAAQRLYKEWFVELRFPGHEKVKVVDGVPEGWERKKLIEIADVQYGFAFDGHLFNDKGEGTPILRIRNIPDGYTKDYTTQEATSEYIVNDGDIVVGMDGIFHINTWCGGKAYLVQRTCSFRPKKTEIKGFVLQAIYDPIKYFESTVVGATVAHLGKKHIDSIELLVPSDSKMFEALQKMYESRQNLLSQIRNLTESRDRMLVKLMSGEIEV